MTVKSILFSLLVFVASTALAQQTEICVVHTSDTHSCIEPISINNPDSQQADKGGFLRRVALMNQLRQENPNLLLLDCGDFSQGSAYYNLYKGEVEVKLMNEMQYDAVTIGNHEFDFGLENMARIFRMAHFPVVCCNYDFTGTPLEGLVKPYIVKECGGVRVGILGVGAKMKGLVTQANMGATKYTAPDVAAGPIVDRLRNEEHCDLVICLSHLGTGPDEDNDPAFIARTTGIDLVLGGHSHTYMSPAQYILDQSGNAVLLDHQGKNARYVGVIKVDVKTK